MAADVVKGVNPPVASRVTMMLSPATSRSTNRPGRDLVGAAGADPAAAEEQIDLARETGGVDVEPRRQRARACGMTSRGLTITSGSAMKFHDTTSACPPPAARDPGLRRELGRWDLTAIGVNQVIGAAVFVQPALYAASVGAWSPWIVAAVGFASLLIALSFAEVSSRFDGTGGAYLYTRAAFGRFAAFEVGWMLWFTRAASWAAVINVLATALGFYVPALTGGWPRATLSSRSSSRLPAQRSRHPPEQPRAQRPDRRQAPAAYRLHRRRPVLRRPVAAGAAGGADGGRACRRRRCS